VAFRRWVVVLLFSLTFLRLKLTFTALYRSFHPDVEHLAPLLQVVRTGIRGRTRVGGRREVAVADDEGVRAGSSVVDSSISSLSLSYIHIIDPSFVAIHLCPHTFFTAREAEAGENRGGGSGEQKTPLRSCHPPLFSFLALVPSSTTLDEPPQPTPTLPLHLYRRPLTFYSKRCFITPRLRSTTRRATSGSS
jgi:hypothetical protein